MDAEISRLGLPRGVWQQLIKEAIPNVAYVVCEYPDSRTMDVKCSDKNEKPIAQFSMSFLYGCKGILVSHAMHVENLWRNKGIAKALQPIKARIAKDLKVSLMIATVRSENAAEKAVIVNWKKVDTFTNERTGAIIDIYTTKIKEA